MQKCLEASIDLIKLSDKLKLLQLGIFPEDAEIPYSIAGKLWELDEFDTEELLLKFHRLGLIDLDFPGKLIKIHDVLLRYYAENLQGLKEHHGNLCSHWRDSMISKIYMNGDTIYGICNKPENKKKLFSYYRILNGWRQNYCYGY